MPKTIGRNGANQPSASTIQTFGSVSWRYRRRPVLSVPSRANPTYTRYGSAVAIQIAGLRICIRHS